MATEFIDRLRTARFPTARRGGYNTDAVDAYLRELADWLETGGQDQTRSALVQREMERVGERTGAILAAAQQTADDLTNEARTEAAKEREDAERDAGKTRADADSYATETRTAADEHVRMTAEAAAREAAEMRKEAESEARRMGEEGERHLEEANAEAAAKTANVEEEIAALVEKREAILANLEQLARRIKGTVEGPGIADLDLPEELLARAKATEDIVADEEPSGPDSVAEHPVVDRAQTGAVDPQATELTEPELDEGELAEAELEETQIAEQEVAEAELEDELPEDDDEPTDVRPADDTVPAYDADEQERVRQRELERRRNPASRTDPPTEDSSLSDLL